MLLKPLAKVTNQLSSEPTTLQYPEERESLADNYKGIHKLDMKTCISCSACSLICPNQTITMVETETERGTKKMPEINLDRCLFCSLCEEICPPKCLVLTKDYKFEAYDRRDYVKRPEELD